MGPEYIVLAAYWLFGIWMYTMGSGAKNGSFKSEGAHVITVLPSKKTDVQVYGQVYAAFHVRIMMMSFAMGVFCVLARGVFPVVAGSLVFFGYLNLYKYKTEEKLRAVCGGK